MTNQEDEFLDGIPEEKNPPHKKLTELLFRRPYRMFENWVENIKEWLENVNKFEQEKKHNSKKRGNALQASKAQEDQYDYALDALKEERALNTAPVGKKEETLDKISNSFKQDPSYISTIFNFFKTEKSSTENLPKDVEYKGTHEGSLKQESTPNARRNEGSEGISKK